MSSTTSNTAVTTIPSTNNNIDAQQNNDKNNNLILVVGSSNQDLTTTSDILPALGETVMGKSFAIACGGKGANQAVAAASLKMGYTSTNNNPNANNMASVAMVTRVGDDLFGKNILDNFRRVGVNYFDEEETIVKDKNVQSGVANIAVETKSGDNQIIVTPGANFLLTEEDVRKKVIQSKPSQVLVQLEILPSVAFQALKSGKDAGAITILNTAPAPEGYSLEDPSMPFFKYADILILNETELRKVCVAGDTDDDNDNDDDDEEALAKSLFIKGVRKAVIVTLGARGAMIVEKNDDSGGIFSTTTTTTRVNAHEDLTTKMLGPVINTVGAGDAFCGTLCAYRSTGMTLIEASKYACGVASMTVRKDGAQTSYPLYDELPNCLKL